MPSSPISKSDKAHIYIATVELQDTPESLPGDVAGSVLSQEIQISREQLYFKADRTKEDIPDPKEDHRKIKVLGQTNPGSPPLLKEILTTGISPIDPMFHALSFIPSPRGPCFATSSQSYWYHRASPLLGKLLSSAKYPSHLQDRYLFFFNHSILPALGPAPSPTRTWTPNLTHNNSPFEPSLNFKGNHTQVSFKFEPVRPHAGTPEDPFNQCLPLAFVSSLTTTCPDLNLDWWTTLTKALFVSDSESARSLSLTTEAEKQPSCCLEFLLPNTAFAPVLNAYLFPHRRALLEGKSRGEIVFEAAKDMLSSTAKFAAALEKVESFITGYDDKDHDPEPEISKAHCPASDSDKTMAMSVEMLSFDCVHPLRSRLAVHIKIHKASFANIVDVYTLGGLLNSHEITKGLVALKEFWRCLLLLEEDWNGYDEQSVDFVYFAFEMGSESNDPNVRLYVPSWTCGIDKTGLSRGLAKYFKEQDWDVGSSHRKNIQDVIGGRDSREGAGYTYISFAYGTKGPHITTYFAPNKASQ